MVSDDVMRSVIGRLSLWDARSMQRAHPSFARLVSETVGSVVHEAARAPRPRHVDRCIATFLKGSQPAFQESVNGNFTCMRTPLHVHLSHAHQGVVVSLSLTRERACVAVRVVDPACRPSMETAYHALAAVRWFADAVEDSGRYPPEAVQFQTRATIHRPVSEVMNGLADQCVRHWATQKLC